MPATEVRGTHWTTYKVPRMEMVVIDWIKAQPSIL